MMKMVWQECDRVQTNATQNNQLINLKTVAADMFMLGLALGDLERPQSQIDYAVKSMRLIADHEKTQKFSGSQRIKCRM